MDNYAALKALDAAYERMVEDLCAPEHRELYWVSVSGMECPEGDVVERAAWIFGTMSELLARDSEISPVESERYKAACESWSGSQSAAHLGLARLFKET